MHTGCVPDTSNNCVWGSVLTNKRFLSVAGVATHSFASCNAAAHQLLLPGLQLFSYLFVAFVIVRWSNNFSCLTIFPCIFSLYALLSLLLLCYFFVVLVDFPRFLHLLAIAKLCRLNRVFFSFFFFENLFFFSN